MPAVVRVKRRIDEEPLGAFVLNGKKRRTNNGVDCGEAATSNKDEISTILKFAGTVNSQDDTTTTQFARLSKIEAKELVQKSRKPTNVTERTRQEMRQNLHESRFKVVNCFRKSLENENNANDLSNNTTPKEITIVDIEKQTNHSQSETNTAKSSSHPDVIASTSSISLSSSSSSSSSSSQQQQPTDSDTGYVYDLYLPENEQQAENVDLMDDNHLSYRVRAFDDLIYEDRFNNDDEEYDSDDSNQENYIGNDYPDEDDDDDIDHESIEERKIRRAVKKFNFDDSDDSNSLETLSSDDDDDDDDECNLYRNESYVFSIDTEENDFDEDVDRYGSAYARYKARVLKEMNSTEDDDNFDDDESDSLQKTMSIK